MQRDCSCREGRLLPNAFARIISPSPPVARINGGKERESSPYVKQKGLGKFSSRCEERREGERVAWQFIGLGRQMRRRETEQTMCFPRSIMRRLSGLGREEERWRRRQIETYHRFETSFITPPQSLLPFTRLSFSRVASAEFERDKGP